MTVVPASVVSVVAEEVVSAKASDAVSDAGEDEDPAVESWDLIDVFVIEADSVDPVLVVSWELVPTSAVELSESTTQLISYNRKQAVQIGNSYP